MQLVFGLGCKDLLIKTIPNTSKHRRFWEDLEVKYGKLWMDPQEPPGAVVGHEGSSAAAEDAPLEEHTAMMASPPLTKWTQRHTKMHIGAYWRYQI